MTIFDCKKVHFIGIGGISMSGIAHILLERGIEITGSDQSTSEITKTLQKAGAHIFHEHKAEYITDQEMVIYTGAIKKDNPEYVEATNKNIPMLARTEALNQILQLHENIIAVAGTHGKTTVTSMITHIFRKNFDDISYMIGAHLNATNKSYNLIESPYITVEACEYQANFLQLYPTCLLVNNIEPEHMDYYKNIEQLIDTFSTFAHHLPKGSNLIVNADDKNCQQLLTENDYNITTYGIENNADYQAKNIKLAVNNISFDLYVKGQYKDEFKLNLFGNYNIINALGAIACADLYHIDFETIKLALASFVNSDRRFEKIGTFNGATVISDYAHHPSEVKASISGATAIKDKKIVLVFQPHTYSRTHTMLHEFATAFHGVDELYITDIYAAREKNIYKIHAEDLTRVINKAGQHAEYIGELSNIKSTLEKSLDQDSLLIIMGAGSIDAYARQKLC